MSIRRRVARSQKPGEARGGVFRVLTLTKSRERATNLRKIAEEVCTREADPNAPQSSPTHPGSAPFSMKVEGRML